MGAWGVQGAIKVAVQSADASALLHARRWWFKRIQGVLINRSTSTSYDVVSKRIHGEGLVANLATISDRDAAANLSGHSIFLPRAGFPKTPKGEFYWVDLIGCQVVNRAGERLGDVVGLIDTGVHSVLRVAPAPAVVDGDIGASQATAERLIPFVDAYVDKTDLKARRIDVDWGLDY